MAQAKQAVCKRVYTYADGTTGNRARPDAVGLAFHFAGGEVLETRLEEIGETCRNVALPYHGLSQNVGDRFNKAKGDSAQAFDDASARYELLCADEWAPEGEAPGPRITQLVSAIIRALRADNEEVDDAREEAIVTKLSGSDDAAVNKKAREGALANPVIAAELKAIQAEAAMERADKARTKADEADADETALGAF